MRKFMDVSAMPEKFGTSERTVAGKVSGKLSAVSLLNSQEAAVEPAARGHRKGCLFRNIQSM
jgi:hypothetical protein